MMEYENNFAKILFRNAIMFLDAGVGFINKGFTTYRNMVQAIVNLQMAMELALKSSVVSYCGIRTVLNNKQSELSDLEIEELFNKNLLKIREYDDIKNYTKGKNHLYDFERKQYNYMEKFQKYRNCILHSSYIFTDEETKQMEKDIIYTLIHILGILISDETLIEERKYMQEYLNKHEYALLLKNPVYNTELNVFLNNEYGKLYMCPYCSTKTMTSDYKCARCFSVFADRHFFEYVRCGYCGEDMVICDAANIDNRDDHMVRGLCLNCKVDTIVYKCPKCGKFVNTELFGEDDCHGGFCQLFD